MDTKASLRSALDAAADRLTDDAVEAERLAKAISAVVRAERDLAEFLATPATPSPEENDERIRAELRGRLDRLLAAQRAGAPLGELERLAVEVGRG